MIISKDNKKIKYAKGLLATKNRKKESKFLVEGKKNIELAKQAECVEYIITTDESYDGLLVSEAVMKEVVSTANLIDSVAVCNYPTFDTNSDKVLILDDIQDPGNLGTLIRSALAFNFDKVVCSHKCADYTNPKVVRSSAGAIFNIEVIYTDLVEYLKLSENPTIGTFIDGSTNFQRFDKFNLVIGNEGNGISKEVEELCDIKYRIDINETLDSLNAAIAGSILMHQLGGSYDI